MPLEPNRSQRPRRPRQSRRSRHELLAIRKELVLTRIAVERAELIQASHVTRERLRNFRWVRYLLPGGFSNITGLGGLASSGLKLGGLLERYPLVSSVASIALTGLSHTPVGRLARRGLKWGSLGVLAWQGIKLWQESTKSSPQPSDAPGSSAPSVPRASGTTPTPESKRDDRGAPPLM
ncbi:hypothetical protein UC34_17905 [Pandoraea vervacti]|uniref:DUF3318 domain-containing protein n=1 Tax=Pandoraea vervacti TaxID=656178 RepID=A0ABN4U7H4_9BURK|nr:DUF3318 domain-containing protein [Pandoraea vervacti]APD11364.1 hypothetical protein UC34_17905 [Pandoraea vervacti]